ncbi:CTP synthase [Pontibacter diazotrophicus]|uniref:CTP synthase (glutamine hydrolyzing) n=1 Tax=Pontibacter diazotrophicus TaxID=1400979 RepID=A0A3D8L380_9BACT|nr:CTP synthase [Pontibacter diazotrophicus]RDV11861.1 CTP synthase [Pontibacter diazotrophicus]
MKTKLAIIGDYNDTFRPHKATNEGIEHSIKKFDIQLQYDWIATDTIETDFNKIISTYNGFWIAPGSPYKSMAGALRIIKYARENSIPTLGTCGGFQHMVIEFARNVLGISDAEHAEYDPYSSKLVVNPLSCSLAGQILEIELTDKTSKIFEIFGTKRINERYHCNFGLNPEYQNQLDGKGFKIVGTDIHKEARILELENHPFFIATLFVPQDNSSVETPHKLVTEFLRTVTKNKSTYA